MYGSKPLRSLTSFEPFNGSTIAWAPCKCCQNGAVCDRDPATVWDQELASLDVLVVLQYGCVRLTGPADNVLLRYPAANETASRRLMANPLQEVGNVPVNMVRLRSFRAIWYVNQSLMLLCAMRL